MSKLKCEPVWPRGKAGKQTDLGSNPLWLSFLFKICDLWTLFCRLWLGPSQINKTLKWLSSLPILMQESFWWWQCSDRYIISLFPHLCYRPPSLISLMVSVDVKHHVYLLTSQINSDSAHWPAVTAHSITGNRRWRVAAGAGSRMLCRKRSVWLHSTTS